MTRRLTSSSLAGTWRKLVAVGTSSEASMLVAVRAAAPRRGVGSASPAGAGALALARAGAGADDAAASRFDAGAGFAAGGAGAVGAGAAGVGAGAGRPLAGGAPSPAKYDRHSSGTDAGSER
jgi:hypothetical protein